MSTRSVTLWHGCAIAWRDLNRKLTSRQPNCVHLLSVLCLILLVLIPLINGPSVNLEWLFAEAALGINGDLTQITLERYFENQANPLGIPFLISLAASALPSVSVYLVARLLSVIGLLLIMIAAWVGYRSETNPGSAREFLLFALLVASNPLIAIYAIRINADLLPASLLFFIIVTQPKVQSSLSVAITVPLLFAGAIITKYSSLLFLVFYKRNQTGLRLIGSLLGLLVVVLFYLFQINLFGGRLMNPSLYKRHFSELQSPLLFLNTFTRYLAMVALLVCPLLIVEFKDFVSNAKKFIMLLLGALTIAIFSRADFSRGGELDFGNMTRAIPYLEPVVMGLGSGLAVILVWRLWKVAVGGEQWLITGLLVVLVVMSLSRPAQRYLMVFVVVIAYLLTPRLGSKYKVAVSLICTAVLAYCTAVGVWYQREVGYAATRMVTWVEHQNLTSTTELSVVETHVGEISNSRDTPRFVVAALPYGSRCPIHKEGVSAFGIDFLAFCLSPSS